MKIERTKNTVRNVASGFLSRIINIVLPFFTRTALLYILGTQYLGLSSLFTSILSFLSLTELGMGAAMIYSMYKPIAENDKETLCALLNLYKRLYRLIGFIVLILGLSLMPFLGVIVKEELPSDINLHLLYFIYLLNSVLSYWLFAYKNALLQAHQRNDINNNISSIITPLSYAFMLGFLFLTKNYYCYVIWLPIFTVITNLIRVRYVNKLFPDLKPNGNVDKQLKKSITKKVSALIGTKLNTVVLNASDNLVMSAFLGLTVVTIYGNYHYIINSIVGFVGIFYVSMTAGLGNSLQTETVEKNYQDFKNLSFLNAWLVGWCTVCLVCLYQPFMYIWVGEELMFPFYVVLQLAIYFYIYLTRKIPVVYKDAAGIWWEDRYRPYVCMIVNVFFNIILVQIIGISGIVLSTIFSLLVSVPWENYTIFKYVFKRSSFEYYKKMLSYIISMLLGGVLTYFICNMFGNGILPFLIRLPICVVVPNAVFVLLNFRSIEFKNGIALIKRILLRKF